MANIKSAKKRIKQSAKAGVRNLRRKRAAKSGIKELDKAITEKKSVEEIKKILQSTDKALDKAAKGNKAMHRNKAARLKSRIAKKANRGGARGK